jgi:glucosamine 6-phosphate synthetase-like amidotransferase/phosphosugar isomerase protein
MVINIREIQATQSPIIALADEGDRTIESMDDMVIRELHIPTLFTSTVNAVSLQLLGTNVPDREDARSTSLGI